jgi:N-acetylmuramic acid 6-phosphate etherase
MSHSSSPGAAAAADFLAVAFDFKLGSLDTESQHPLTVHLSQDAVADLPKAFAALKAVDLAALEIFCSKAAGLVPLAAAMATTLEAGKKIYLCGCGATGRLSLSLEIFCHEGLLPAKYQDHVIGFMAGGDLALIKAIEKFEDRPEFGARQLQELGFADGDLLISSTEGGETPFVIGATEYAAQHSRNQPWFLYCNPDEELIAVAERSKRVIDNPRIHKLNLAVGPMAISGSTRMQASTILMAAIGFCFEAIDAPETAALGPQKLLDMVLQLDFAALAPFTVAETAAYKAHEYVLYEPSNYGITVLTDTTERAPTFTLLPFEDQTDPAAKPSWCHLWCHGQATAHAAWEFVLHRQPRTLEWEDVKATAGREVLVRYDFSNQLLHLREKRMPGKPHHQFTLKEDAAGVHLSFRGHQHLIPLAGKPSLYRHLAVKVLLNSHSTLIMGRMGRYQDNLMTYVKPSNNKLIDRAIRYIRLLLARQHNLHPSYETVAQQLFKEREAMEADEAIVLKTLHALLASGDRELES